MIDRKKGPKITTEFDLSVNSVIHNQLSNGVELYEINDGTQEIIKIELLFKTGRVHETQVASAKTTLGLLREGSTRNSAAELAHLFDFYGASVKSSCNMEYASVSLVVVERYFHEVWPIWFAMVFYPSFPDEELEKHKKVYSQKLQEQLSENDVQSYRRLTEMIFGADHPYGYNTEPKDILALSRGDLLDFYNSNMGTNGATAVLSGKYSENTRATIAQDFSKLNRQSMHPNPKFYLHPPQGQTEWVKTKNDIQTSIKLGRVLFPRNHPDYGKLRLLNMILGGYFGSRLMKNIREEKGYTYGIYSSVHCWQSGGFIYISADVDNAYIDPTLEQIRLEMDRLRSEAVDEEELSMVKTYLLGQTLHLLDGPFAKGQLIKNLKVAGRNLSQFEQSVEELKATTPDDLVKVAQEYLRWQDYTIVLAGNPTNK